MFDIEALEAAGFQRMFSTEEWEALNRSNPNPRQDYFLRRGDVQIATEQNTTEVDTGISTTVRYPEIAVIFHSFRPLQRVTCDASDTDLILLLAEELDSSDPSTRKR